MWLLGAGASRSANMPTATDIIWDLKLTHYCRAENQDISKHDIANIAVQQRVQSYFEARGAPAAWSPEEYSYYFDTVFGGDYTSQQKYIAEQLAPGKISLNIGQRALAALTTMGLVNVVFTTNFDDVIETAYAAVSGKSIAAFHLEGSYAALAALNSDQFPLYAKMHGDFRYQSVKNLTADLRDNDAEIQKAFLAASTRFGLVVSGYSGRDANVMSMLGEAIAVTNAFPHGIFWAVTKASEVSPSVKALIEAAQGKGIRAHIVETGTFDIMLSKMWRQVSGKSDELDLKVRTTKVQPVTVPLPAPGTKYPILRTNAFPITAWPTKLGVAETTSHISYRELTELKEKQKPSAVITRADGIIFCGPEDEVRKVIGSCIKSIADKPAFDAVVEISRSTHMKEFYEEALARSLKGNTPVQVRERNGSYYFIVTKENAGNLAFQALRVAVGYQGKEGPLTGIVPNVPNASWHEAISVRLEERDRKLWLLIRPTTWISPVSERENAKEFLRTRTLRRYNHIAFAILDAWKKVLFADAPAGEATVSCFNGATYPVVFKIKTLTAFSRKG